MTRISRAIAFLAFAGLAPLQAPALAQASEPGSLLVFPEYDNQCNTLITVTNTNSSFMTGGISTRWVYVESPGCLTFDRTEVLTASDTLSVVTSAHRPGVSRGYLYVFAVDPMTNQAVSFNHLIGASMRFDCMGGSEYALNPVVFKGIAAERSPTDLNGNGARDLDGVEYEQCADEILIPRFLGQNATFTSDLILLNLSGGPSAVSVVRFAIFNDNEEQFSAQLQYSCWQKIPLNSIAILFQNAFLQMTGHNPTEIKGSAAQESGWFRVDGVSVTEGSSSSLDPATLAFLIERGSGGRAAGTPFGLGQQDGNILSPLQPPVCPGGVSLELWPPNHSYHTIDLTTVAGVTDPLGLAVSIVITSITQDEPINANGNGDGNTVCDGTGVGTSVAQIRAERAGGGDGRVYRINYTATNTAGLSCMSTVNVTVPHDQAHAAVESPVFVNSSDGCP